MTQLLGDEDLFAAALIMPAAERGHFLARACDGDSALQRFTTLLDSFDDAASFVRLAPSTAEQIDSYRLLRELGEGGCGIVYLAEQLAPVQRQVAVKIIKPGMDTKSVVARFEAERQLLALMDHPNVAKVFDAGSTASGPPYFVMELVRGINITEYCDLLRLSVAERLQIFIQVCLAIQHAHHKGVMHRDIKPSNVLVTMHDGLPLVKVIDFGIAKATQGPSSGQTLHTALGHFIGTPAYISPEQTELTQRNVDTRSDIYSLGVLLYELLTGCTPLDTHDLLASSAEEMRRRVREDEPPTPSARLKTNRQSVKDVQGDLDWIVMRCLEKEPTRRYQSVSDLILDIQRHQRYEPIVARPPSFSYVVAKFAHRNRRMFAAMIAATAFVVAFAIGNAIQMQRVAAARDRAEQENQRAQEVAQFMLDTLSKAEPFGYADTGQPETAQQLLDRAGRWAQQDRNQDPEVRARLLESIGRAHRRRLDDTTAIGFLQDALDLRRKRSGSVDDAATVQVINELAASTVAQGDLSRANELIDEAAAALHRLGLEHSLLYAQTTALAGRLEVKFGRPEHALRQFDAALALSKELQGPRGTEVATILMDKSTAFSWQEELQQAEDTARQALDIYREHYPKLHPEPLLAQMRLGDLLRQRHKLQEASRVLRDALSSQRQVFGQNNRNAADILDSLARIVLAQDKLVEADALAQQALQTSIEAEGAGHVRTAYYRTSLAMIHIERREYAKAEMQLRAALAVFGDRLPPDHPYAASTEYFLGDVMLATHRWQDAEVLFRASMSRSQRAHDPEWRIARSASGLGEALSRQGRVDEAEPHFVNSQRILALDPAVDERMRTVARERWTRFHKQRAQLASGGSR